MKTKSQIELTDFGCAVALLAQGFSLQEVKPLDERRCVFVFDKEATAEAIRKYFSNELLVPAQEFYQQSRLLKSRLYSRSGRP